MQYNIKYFRIFKRQNRIELEFKSASNNHFKSNLK